MSHKSQPKQNFWAYFILSEKDFYSNICRKFLTQVLEKPGFGRSNKNRYGQGEPPLGFNCEVCPWELFAGSNPPDKFSLKKIHEHAGVERTWSEILRLQLGKLGCANIAHN